MDYEAFKAQVRAEVERLLDSSLAGCGDSEVCRAARYVTLGGGHRWRALVAVAAGRIFHPEPLPIVLPAAAGIELAHAASLILDDLPSMDDASLRRGKPCAHRVFARWAVDLAPVFLVTLSYRLALGNALAPAERRLDAAVQTSLAGLGMVAGQEHDVQSSGAADSDELLLLRRYELKSGLLYGSAAASGARLCGASEDQTERLRRAGTTLGLAYQFQDDVADAVAHAAEVGKDVRSDTSKPTAVSLFGVDDARARSRRYQDEAASQLAGWGEEADFLRRLIGEASWAAA